MAFQLGDLGAGTLVSFAALLACSVGSPGEDEAAVTTNPSGSDDDEGSSSESESGPKFDIGGHGDCTVTIADDSVLAEHPDCLPEVGGCGVLITLGCVVPGPGQSCAAICPEGNCVEDWSFCAGDFVGDPDTVCGPYEIDGQCCSIGQNSYECTG